MGYIGLLLNDPYKIDRMVGDCLIHFFFYVFFACRVAPRLGLREPKVKRGHSKDIGVFGV
jgi:hypothetical protein